MQCDLSDELRLEIAQLLYNKWASSWDMLQFVKHEVSDGSSDWQSFYAKRLSEAIKAEKLANDNLAAFMSYTPKLSNETNFREDTNDSD